MQRLRYKPLRRYVAHICSGDNNGIVLKAYGKADYEAAQKNARALQSRGSLQLARRLGRSGRYCLLALEWLPGRLLEDVMAAPHLEVEKVAAVGAALAELHAQEAKQLARPTPAAGVKALRAVARDIAFVCPHLAGRTDELARRISALMSDQPLLDDPIHNDFYVAQVLSSGNKVVILDLDQAGRGDPAVDLATFIAHLESDAMRGHLDPARVEPVKTALLQGYQAASREFIPARLPLFTAARLFRLTPHPFRQREDRWPEKIEVMLDRVAALLKPVATGATVSAPRHRVAEAGRETAVVVGDPLAAASDPEMPFLRRALSPLEMQYLLADNLARLPGAAGQIYLRAIRVTRHKPGRRCVIEYDLELQRPGAPAETISLVGKANARRLKRSIFELLESLWAAGFGANSQDGILIPEPVAMIPELHMWLQRKVSGAAAMRMLAGPDGVALAGRITEAAHKIHRASVPIHRRHTISNEMAILNARLGVVAQARLEWLDRLERLLAACHRLASTIPAVPPAGIHRDFYPDQILVDGARLYVLDFDLYCKGDPALDIGNFLGHVKEHSLRSAGDAHALANRESALEERFVELNANLRRPAAVRLAVQAYTTLTLARHIYISTQFPTRQAFTSTLLDLCEQRLDLAQRPYDRCQLPYSPKL